MTPGLDEILRIPAVSAVSEIDWRADDVVLLAVKSDATAGLLRELAAAAPAETAIVCLQNGVANEPAALRFFPHVYGVCVMAPTGHLEPGVVEASCHPTSAILDVGRFPEGVDERADTIAAALDGAAMVSVSRSDIMRWKYRKLIMNIGNAVQATCGQGEAADVLTTRARVEAEEVLARAGIPTVSEAEDVDRRGDILVRGTVPGSQKAGGSSWQSLQRGTGTIESDYLNGEIVWLGRQHGVPTPVNGLLRDVAVRCAREGLAPGSLDASDLLASLAAGEESR